MPAQLVALTEGPNILLDRPILLIGRHPECDIHIESRKISRRHCCIAQVQDFLVVRDLDSTNGIRINGVRVLEGRLRAGDELTIGHHRYQVAWSDARPVGKVVPAVPGKQPVPASIPLPASDSDSWDEPVALPEPDAAARQSPRPPTNPPPTADPSAVD